MNYILILNHFWRMYSQYDLHANEIALYLLLLDSCNSYKWKETFKHSNSYLCLKLRISESTLIRCRQKLIDAGLIKYISGKNTQECSYYSIVDISAERSEDNPTPTTHATTRATAIGTTRGTTTGTTSGTTLKRMDNNKLKHKHKKKQGKVKGSELNLKSEEGKPFIDQSKPLDLKILKIFNDFNKICIAQKKVERLGEKRESLINDCITEFGIENIEKMLQKVAESDFLAGENRFGWIAQFEWIFNIENCTKIIEGAYDNDAKTIPGRDKPTYMIDVEEAYAAVLAKDKYFSED